MDALINAIEELQFLENELALLGLTGKVELPVRDRIFYTLFHQRPDLYVAREVSAALPGATRSSAVDLVVGTLGVELKAFIAEDLNRPFMERRVQKSIDNDLLKMYTTEQFDDMCSILLVAIAENEVPLEYRSQVRYGHSPSSPEDTEKDVSRLFPGRVVHTRIVPVGRAYGVRMSIGIFVIR